jgi:hypothetical protein
VEDLMLRTMRADAVEWEQNFPGSSQHKSYLGHVTRLDRGP